jgi:hypothetical protein
MKDIAVLGRFCRMFRSYHIPDEYTQLVIGISGHMIPARDQIYLRLGWPQRPGIVVSRPMI